MDILYIVNKSQSACDNQELRWSLRSIEKHGKNVGRVFITDQFDFLSGKVTCVSPSETKDTKCKDILNRLLYAIEQTDISEEFLVSMDDHCFVRDVDFDKFPYYVRDTDYGNGPGMLPTHENTPQTGAYIEILKNTAQFLQERGLPTITFCGHFNMHCSKSLVYEFIEKYPEILDLEVERWACFLNYLYSKQSFEFVLCKDRKIVKYTEFEDKLEDAECISLSDMVTYCKSFAIMQNMFPHKSQYEL